MNIVLMLSGSIAAYKACELASSLVKAGHAVQALLTESALKMVGAATLEGLTGRRVYTDAWAPGDGMAHIELRRWADLYVLYPATANRINELAAGLAHDLLGSTFLANNFQKPFWIAPAMNPEMLTHPATQASLERLESWGCRLLFGGQGRMACGDYGLGRLMEPEEALALIQTQGAVDSGKRPARRLLLTGGAMTEAIDAVRVISNRSTGKTASTIAAHFLAQGWQVDYLHHESADLTGANGSNRTVYRNFADLDHLITEALSANSYEAIIHAAAVSDYRVANPVDKKISSDGPIKLELVPNPKLIDQLRSRAHQGERPPVICAFKFTSGANETAAKVAAAKILKPGHADLVVWNDAATYQEGRHPFAIFGSDAAVLVRGQTTAELATNLLNIVESRLEAV